MASAIIHLAIAKKLKEKMFIKNEYDYLLGAIAPDIAKQVGKTKLKSHFLINNFTDVPNLNIFTKKYPDFKYNSFDLGYFSHLYADKVWFEEFLPNLVYNSSIKLLDGTIIQTKNIEEINNMIYSDYTNININTIENYDLDLSIFYEEFKEPKTKVEEIPIDKLDILINKMSIIIENSKSEKSYMFDMYSIDKFIEKTVDLILKELKKY